jgi:hypothetical protein
MTEPLGAEGPRGGGCLAGKEKTSPTEAWNLTVLPSSFVQNQNTHYKLT